jgi:hypothetical protein
MLAWALLGTVTGYYFGRVPAELRAQKAEESATTAHSQLGGAHAQAAAAGAEVRTVKAKASDLLEAAKRVRDELAAAGPDTRTSLMPGVSPPTEALDRTLRYLDDAIRRAELL